MSEAEIMSPLDTLWSEINEAHGLTERCSANARRAAGEAIQHAISCGALLEQAKANVKHGEWAAERDEHFEGSERTAQLYQQLFNGRHHLESATVADLTLNGAAKIVSKAEKEAKRAEENAARLDEIDASGQETYDPVDLGRIDAADGESDAAGKVAKLAQRLEAAQAIVGAAVAEMDRLVNDAQGSERDWLDGLRGWVRSANDDLVEFVELGMRGGE